MQTKRFGNWGENYACDFLSKRKYKIIEKNFRTNFGEIDIIAIKDNTLVLVEVKTRLTKKFGKPEEAVTPHKIKKISKVGEFFCQTHKDLPKKIRIDVVAIQVNDKKVISAKLIPVI